MSNSQKSFMSVRSKLIAAVAMLLVASFMVVSSTYAWFTLSTAPEVTGITTQIGANGNLEIALNTGNAPTNYTGNSSTVDKNTTWGNLIDLSSDSYGINTITLKPSILSVGINEDGNRIVNAQPLITPVYGADGRVSSLSKNSFYGASDGQGGFIRNDNGGYGVRALGTVSNMTKQQLQYVTSVAAINTNLTAATSAANISLRANGTALVELLLKGLAGSDDATFTTTELAPLGSMIASLEEVPGKLETVLKNYLLVMVSKTYEGSTDSDFAGIVGLFNTEWDDIFEALNEAAPDATTVSVDVSTEIIPSGTISLPVDNKMRALITAYNSISYRLFNEDTTDNAQLGAAVQYSAIVEENVPVDFDAVKGVLTPLMDIESISIGGKTYAEISGMRSEMSKLMAWAAGLATSGCVIEMPVNSGVYADIASVTSNISVSFTAKNLNVTVQLPDATEPTVIPLETLDITMKTTLDPASIKRIGDLTPYEPADKVADSTAVISDTYAYVLDFAFRTNAANSNLLLQQGAKDRIYNTNTNTASETMGSGSYMEFHTQQGFGEESILGLMGNIRFVFVDTDTSEILAVGGLDTTSTGYVSDGASVKATIALYEFATKNVDGDTTITIQTGDNGAKVKKTTQSITSLGQNQVTNISVYVYLDGETMTNADVPALENIIGEVNLQFASDAELKPMDYANLKPQTPNA